MGTHYHLHLVVNGENKYFSCIESTILDKSWVYWFKKPNIELIKKFAKETINFDMVTDEGLHEIEPDAIYGSHHSRLYEPDDVIKNLHLIWDVLLKHKEEFHLFYSFGIGEMINYDTEIIYNDNKYLGTADYNECYLRRIDQLGSVNNIDLRDVNDITGTIEDDMHKITYTGKIRILKAEAHSYIGGNFMTIINFCVLARFIGAKVFISIS